jgi:hypothetical protein
VDTWVSSGCFHVLTYIIIFILLLYWSLDHTMSFQYHENLSSDCNDVWVISRERPLLILRSISQRSRLIIPQQQSWGVYWIQHIHLSVRRPCSVFWTYFGLILQILKWNLVWLFPIMSYRSRLSFIDIDKNMTELWHYDTYNLDENFCFPYIFLINFWDFEMNLCMTVYSNELQIKFEFGCYWLIFARVMALGLGHISEVKFAAGGILDI